MEDYFSIDDILSSEPRIYATFHVQAHQLAHLDPAGAAAAWSSNKQSSAEDRLDLPSGHRLALPFWLADSLAQRGVAALELPRCFATGARHALRADARAVHLQTRCPAFYALGLRIAKLVRDSRLSETLVRAFADRCWGIVDSAVFAGARGVAALEGLEEKERKLFFAAHGLDIALRRWKERRIDCIGMAHGVLGKRCREEGPGSPVTPSTSMQRLQ